ncbi:hypothetical protein ACEQ8H_004375 [Pleosporales sp. CAS-2024a]
MALKRKGIEDSQAPPEKQRRRTGARNSTNDVVDTTSTHPRPDADTDAQWDEIPDGMYDDRVADYTEKGTLRADSEARRQWNYVCTYQGCDKRFNRPVRLEQHMRSHNKERPFVCSEPGCDKTFPRKDHLQRHVKNAHNDPAVERTFACNWHGCGKSFTSNGRLQRHQEVHESKFYCTDYPPCYEPFRSEKALTAHVKSQHLEVKPYSCAFADPETGETCAHGYQTESALHRHVVKNHQTAKEDTLFCMVCGCGEAGNEAGDDMPIQPLSFATQEELTAHVQQHHPPECSECGQRFSNDSNLRAHFGAVHASPSSQPQYPCPKPDCASVFNRKYNLAVHVQTVHDKQFRYQCTWSALETSRHEDLKNWDGANACGAAFKAKSSLDQHVRTHHLGLGNRKQVRKAAKSCKKKPSPSTLSMLTGVGYEQNRQVACLVKTCEYRFYRDRDLRRHLRAVHDMADGDMEEMMRERDALSGGPFWIGGLDDDDAAAAMFDSAEPSMPQTPAPYLVDGGAAVPMDMDKDMGFFDTYFDGLSLMRDDEDMDAAMGLEGLAPAKDVQEGLGWDLLALVDLYT